MLELLAKCEIGSEHVQIGDSVGHGSVGVVCMGLLFKNVKVACKVPYDHKETECWEVEGPRCRCRGF